MSEATEALAGAAKYAVATNGAIDTTTIMVTTEPISVDLRTACRMVSLSMPVLRAEMAKGRLNAKTYGTKPLFEVEELKRYVASLPSWEPK
jgi:hypothetical protein